MAEIISFLPRRCDTYSAKSFRGVTDTNIEHVVSGTLCGSVDFYIHDRLINMTVDEAVKIANNLLACVKDIQQHCLYDRDALFYDGEKL